MTIESGVNILTRLTSLRWLRSLLIAVTKKCETDGDTRLNITLDLIAGRRTSACITCRISAILIRAILAIGSTAFGTAAQVVQENLKDHIFRRSMSSIISGLARFGVTKPFTPGAPFQVVWNVTKSCNLRCKHCYESAGTKAPDELSTEQALKTVDKLADAGVVFLAFSGGEPTIRPDILALIRRATEQGIYVAVATNGISFSDPERVRKFKRAGMRFVQISIDGANAETHDEFRGVPGAFDKTVSGIMNCVAESLFVEVSTTVTRHNIGEIHEVISLCEDWGVRWLMFYNLVPVGRGIELIDTDLTPDEREYILNVLWERISNEKDSKLEVLTTAPQLGRVAYDANLKSKCKDEIVAPTHFSNARLPSQMVGLTEFIGGCGAGRFYVSLEPNGDLYPCVFFPHIERMKVGNILTDNFEVLWTHSSLLYRLRNKNLLHDECGSCERRYVCGGCRARALSYFGDELAPDPGCINNRDHWKKLTKECTSNLDLLVRPSTTAGVLDLSEG